ncbi:MAG: CHAD domain-containing protein [Phycisphaerae bacterium]
MDTAHAFLGQFTTLIVRIGRSHDALRRSCGQDSVHNFRVTCRRLREVLRVVQSVNPTSSILKTIRDLRATRSAWGPVRDLDVLALRLSRSRSTSGLSPITQSFLKRYLDKERRILVNRIRKGNRWKASSTLRASCQHVLQDSRPWILRFSLRRSLLRHWTKQLACVMQCDGRHVHDWHAVRIAIKRLRYLSECFDSEAVPRIHGIIRSTRGVQERLGVFHDHLCEAEYFGKLLENPPSSLHQPEVTTDMQAYRARVQQAAKRELVEVQRHWTLFQHSIEAFG